MGALTSVEVGALSVERFESLLSRERYEAFRDAAEGSRRLLEGRVVWNINSTARGGGVAEMLVSLLAYARGVGVDTRWCAISGNDKFFALTKRIHNNLHSAPGDGGPLGDEERRVYEDALKPNIDELIDVVGPHDVVIFHDPQPAGMISALKEALGVPVVWRCHIGIDVPDELTRRAWRFLIPYVAPADAYVFSRAAFAWEGLDQRKIEVIPPVIDAFSVKNQDLSEETVRAILAVAGLEAGEPVGDPVYVRMDGSHGRVERRALVYEGRPLEPVDRVVLQVSRWDRLKDPIGVIEGFRDHVAPHAGAHLVYAGPAVDAVADDPEGKEVLDEAIELFHTLSPETRERMHLACLPMDDGAENAAIVNALQRRATVVVQKSIAEGFGLTVAEAMWKARPVVATKVGGIQDQIADGVSGVLLDDPHDLPAFGAAVCGLLGDPERARRIGQEARDQVRDEFLAARSLLQYLTLIEKLIDAPAQ